jgi:hypothetical protein
MKLLAQPSLHDDHTNRVDAWQTANWYCRESGVGRGAYKPFGRQGRRGIPFIRFHFAFFASFCGQVLTVFFAADPILKPAGN